MATAQEEVLDVLVIGGGWCGLMACKYAKEENLSVMVLEKREDIGGVWKYSEDPEITTVMQSSGMSSSSTVTELSDFPMPEDIGDFPKHWDVWKYLDSYSTKHNLRQNIIFNCTVKSMEKSGNVWNVHTNENVEYRASNVIVCTGVHQTPNTSMQGSFLKNFQGEIVHSGKIKKFQEKHRGKRIMILGGGETASDVLDEYYRDAGNIVWCIPNGQHFFRKYAKLLPHRNPQALDKASSRALKLISPHAKSKPGLAWVCRWTTNGSVIAYQGHGIPEFRNDAAYFHQFINKHAHALDYVDYDKVIPKGPIHCIADKSIYFKDGTTQDVDVIILCTGFGVSFPFLPKQFDSFKLTDLYKYVYFVDDPSVSFVGYVRPIVGSIPGIGEMQVRWVCRAISGKIDLADRKERTKTVAIDQKFWQDYFKHTSQRISTLVEGYTYLDQVAKLSNCYPNYWELFKESPTAFFTAYFAPYNGCSYRLNELEHRQQALRTLERQNGDTITAFNLITILILRLMLFDWFCDILGGFKYRIQTNRYWHKVREWRVTKLLNYIWCTPKRYLFDNKSR